MTIQIQNVGISAHPENFVDGVDQYGVRLPNGAHVWATPGTTLKDARVRVDGFADSVTLLSKNSGDQYNKDLLDLHQANRARARSIGVDPETVAYPVVVCRRIMIVTLEPTDTEYGNYTHPTS